RYGGGGLIPNHPRPAGPPSTKASLVFVRASLPTAAAHTRQPATTPVNQTSLLQPGTRLVARLEAAATTALKTPVVASVEYSYERDGTVIVPAGTKAIGDVQQASTEGYMSIRFH